ncbi:hypothetical protein EG329_011095 [Mollisiaceae sp. DMI_Dod_QoI]|nr:hypothetical protein EG329_011095 [Helotiales sp. DMI_Dod_QoI]
MGFFGPVPAEVLQAKYNKLTKRLILVASGNAVGATSGIAFKRETLMGGLKFSFGGWVGPITGEQQPYRHEQSFAIDLPNRVFPSNTVVFVTQNYPDGKTVDIQYFDGETPPSNTSGTSRGPADSGKADQQISALFKEPFQSAASIPTKDPLGPITVDFDRNFLQLTTSGIVSPNQIAWTFNSLQTGYTQVIVTISGGGGSDIIIKKVYEVLVFLPLGPLPPGTKSTGAGSITPTVGGSKTTAGLTLSFLGFVNIGVNLIKKAFPVEAQLLEVDVTPLIPGPVTNINLLNQVRIIARVRAGKATTPITAILRSTGWGEFGSIETINQPWMEDVVIDWPVKMELTASCKLLQAAGYTAPVENCTLRYPLYPRITEPFYIYELYNGQYVGVGVNDGKIQKFGVGNIGLNADLA